MMRKGKPASVLSRTECETWAGPTAVTCGWRSVSPPAASPKPTTMQRSSSALRPMYSLPTAHRRWPRFSSAPVPFRSCLRRSWIRSAPASWRTWPGPAATSPASSASTYAFGAKWLELLKEIAPRVSRVGVLRDPTTSGAAGQLGAVQGAASLLRVELTALDVREPAALERNMALLAREPNGGLIVLANPTAAVHLNLIVA